MGGGFDPAIFLGTAFRAACTAIELLAALHSSFEKLVLPAALRAYGARHSLACPFTRSFTPSVHIVQSNIPKSV